MRTVHRKNTTPTIFVGVFRASSGFVERITRTARNRTDYYVYRNGTTPRVQLTNRAAENFARNIVRVSRAVHLYLSASVVADNRIISARTVALLITRIKTLPAPATRRLAGSNFSTRTEILVRDSGFRLISGKTPKSYELR